MSEQTYSNAKYRPSEHEQFYYYSLYHESVQQMYFTVNNERCLQNWALGNCFKTQIQAASIGKKIMKSLRDEYKNSQQKKPRDKSPYWYYSFFSGAAIPTTFSSFNERDLEDWKFNNTHDTEEDALTIGLSSLNKLKEKYLSLSPTSTI